MQYPELDIGKFASRHSAHVEMEKHEDEEGYLLMVEVEPMEGEEGYPVSITARPQTVEEVSEFYESQFFDFPSDDLNTVYGNDNSAVRSMRGSNAWARFEAPTEENAEFYKDKGWAVDIEPIIRRMKNSSYQEVMDEISASTLYVVNRAESEGEVGTGLHDFHRNIIREFSTGVEPVEIDVFEDSETAEEYAEKNGEGSDDGDHREGFLEDAEPETERDYGEIVSGTISQAKNQIENVEEDLEAEDWKALLDAEKEGKNRKTFKPYLKERWQEGRSERSDMDEEL